MVLDISQMERYEGPVSAALYPQLTLSLFGLGLLLTSWFFISEVTATQKTKSFIKEVINASGAAVLLGFGAVFLMLWVGIYV